ncbi:MAG TPA: mismatch-specific DNA-glycosylase [Rhodanobacteraceae bacterium]|nr:mismatch-specific DNA-glycosylase [Rhodanobacteraceae bacterium]
MSPASAILPDLLQPGLRLVFCGTAPSRRSAAEGAYYAHPGNFFWRTLHDVGLTERRYAPAEYIALPMLGIGFTDLAKRHFGNDADLPSGAFDAAALRRKIARHAPRVLAFTSKNAAQAALGHAVAYGLQDERIGSSELFVLPSPSGQARRFWNLSVWQALADHVRTLQP